MKGEIFMQKIPKPLLKAMLRVSAYRMKRQEEKRFQAAVRESDYPVQRDICYEKGKSKGHLLDIYENGSGQKRSPLIIYIHGGGLFCGDKIRGEAFCRTLAEKGNIVVSINYRLIPEVTFPEQIGDILSAFRWIDQHQGRIGYDPKAVFVTGDWAGALLAVYAAAVNQNQMLADLLKLRGTRLKIQALGLISGMFYFYQRNRIGRMYSLLFGNHYKEVPYLSYMKPHNLLEKCSIPPCYLVTSEEDMLKESTKAFSAELEKRGIPHQMHCWDRGEKGTLGKTFCVLHPEWKESAQTIEEMLEYFKLCQKRSELTQIELEYSRSVI